MGARMEEFKADTVIFKENSDCKRMYIVLEGNVVLYHDYGGEEEYVIGACGKGKTFGEMNLFTDNPCFYTAVAFSDVKLAWFERNNFDSFVKGYPDSTLGLLENISKSYVLLNKNLQMAINEINSLKKRQPSGSGVSFTDSSSIDSPLHSNAATDIFEELAKLSGSYHFVGKNRF